MRFSPDFATRRTIMSFFLGLLVIAIAILALKTVIKTASALRRCAGGLHSLFRKRRTMQYRSIPFSTGQSVIHLPGRENDWAALSREFRQAILAQGVRASAESRRLSQLELAIEIEKREIELARLKMEKARIKARPKTVRPGHASVKDDRSGATRAVVPVDQLQTLRAATRLGPGSPQGLRREPPPVMVSEVEPSRRQTADPSVPVRH
jgi:hypothetical protein